MVSRKKASIINASTALTAQLVKLLGQFIVQTVFIRTLGAEYLGANGLFTNLITFLSFAELGIGAALSYSFYKPLVDNDIEGISAILNLYRKVYNSIGCAILLLGGMLSYFIPNLVKNSESIEHIRVYFILFLLSSVVSYFFTYNRSLLIANQEGSVDSMNQLFFSVFKYVFQLILLIFFHSYAGFLIVQIVSNLLSNLAITRLARKKYPYLMKNKNIMPDSSVISQIKRNVIGTVSSKVGSVVVNGTDNILISKFIGLTVVGIYSNYALVVTGITTILSQVLNSVIASFGNLGVSERNNVEKQVNLFDQFVFFNGFIVIFIGLVSFVLFQPFVSIWIGDKYHLSNITLLLIVINFVLAQFRPALFLVNAYGLFWGYRYKSIVEALVNFCLSFYLVKYTSMGIDGVLLGTIVGNIFVNSWWDPLILFSGAFHRGILKFYIKYWLYLLIFVLSLGAEYAFIENVSINIHGFIDLIMYAIIISITIGLGLLILLGFTSGGRLTYRSVISYLKNK